MQIIRNIFLKKVSFILIIANLWWEIIASEGVGSLLINHTSENSSIAYDKFTTVHDTVTGSKNKNLSNGKYYTRPYEKKHVTYSKFFLYSTKSRIATIILSFCPLLWAILKRKVYTTRRKRNDWVIGAFSLLSFTIIGGTVGYLVGTILGFGNSSGFMAFNDYLHVFNIFTALIGVTGGIVMGATISFFRPGIGLFYYVLPCMYAIPFILLAITH